MLKGITHAVLSPLFLWAAISAGDAQTAGTLEVTIVLSGTAYQGPPEFELRADGETVGEAALDVPADVEQEFTFSIPDGAAVDELSVVFTNDLFVEDEGDRNLFIRSVTVNGQRYAGSDLEHTARASETDGETLRLLSAGQVLVERPAQGWSFATAGMSEPEEDRPAATTEEDASAEADVAAAEAEMAASTAAEPAASPQCVVVGELSVSGFGSSETAVPEPEKAKIEEYLTLTGKDCSFEVVGYSSSEGPVAVNMQISVARADAVAQFLVSSGVSNKNVTARGAGPTTSFGQPLENRRVTVAAAP